MKKILAIALTLVMVMALTISAFAAETGTVTITVTEADNWWHEVHFNELFDLSLVEGYDTLTITVEGVNLVPGYNGADGGWVQPDAVNGTITIDLAGASLDENAKVALSTGSGDYELTWTLSNAGESVDTPAVDETETDAEPETPVNDAAETPADNTAETPAEPAAPATGLALAVVPAVMALAAAQVTKRR